eukprot:TRINITY_DN8114_c0_g1_i6.p1 TRINITY_DN8114_c0_g1~~TRINITY_DN8114_c0_g1_i6.p1  ORF type:complete len:161 (-),score=21.79 TRINITY_DN8114_c0_g1_i6:6-488(-)
MQLNNMLCKQLKVFAKDQHNFSHFPSYTLPNPRKHNRSKSLYRHAHSKLLEDAYAALPANEDCLKRGLDSRGKCRILIPRCDADRNFSNSFQQSTLCTSKDIKFREESLHLKRIVFPKISSILNTKSAAKKEQAHVLLSLIHICRCRRLLTCRSRWSPYH